MDPLSLYYGRIKSSQKPHETVSLKLKMEDKKNLEEFGYILSLPG